MHYNRAMHEPGGRRRPPRRGRATAACALTLLGVLAARPADAQPRDEAATADRLFEEGRNLLEQGDYAAACPKLRASYGMDPAVGSLLALALCEERAGRIATATALYRDVVVRARAQKDADREQAARARIDALAPEVPRLRVVAGQPVATSPGLQWYVDGDRHEALVLETGAPFDPGPHLVEVRDAGGRSRRVEVELRRGASQTVTIDGWESAPPGSPPRVAVAAPSSSAPAEPAPPSRGGLGSVQTAGLVVGGVGLVGLAIGTVFGVLALGDTDGLDARGTCDDVPDFDACAADYDAAQRDATISTVGLVAGGVLTAAGVGMIVLGAPEDAGTGRGALTVAVRGPTLDARVTF